jgi:uncharacterized damage-inducible protein DinB
MKPSRQDLMRQYLALAEHSLRRHHLPRIEQCLKLLTEKEIWWRPNAASNSAGNLALHLAGNVRQWIVSGLGGAPDLRRRDEEFAERGPLPRAKLIRGLRTAVNDACRVLKRLSSDDLTETHTIQKLRVTGLNAVQHVVEHFAFHSGQIIFITKLKRNRDLAFARFTGGKPQPRIGRKLPVL